MNFTSLKEIEECILGAIISKGEEAAIQASSLLSEEEFTDPDLRILYGVCLSLVLLRKPVDTLSAYTYMLEHADELRDHFRNAQHFTDEKQYIGFLGIRLSDACTTYARYEHGFDLSSFCTYLKIEARRERMRALLCDRHTKLINGGAVRTIAASLIEELYTFTDSIDHDRKYHTGEAMAEMEAKADSSLIHGLIREQSVNIMFGEEGCGKSLLAMNLGINVATGAGKFLTYRILTHGKVLLLNNELPFCEFLSRFQSMVSGLGPDARKRLANLIVPESVPPLESYWGDLNTICRREKPVLVVLDCLYWSHDKKENDSSDMKNIMRKFASLRDEHKLALVIVHHTKKGSRYQGLHNDNMRGSGVFSAATDTNLELRRSEKDEKMRLFKPTKLRYGTDAMRETRLLSLSENSLWFSDNGTAIEEEHIAKMKAPEVAREEIDFEKLIKEAETVTRKDILKRCQPFQYSDKTVDRLISEAVGNGILVKVKAGSYELRHGHFL